jgi:hypothetical protein
VNREAAAGPSVPPERVPKVENCFSRFGDAQAGQLGVRLAVTKISKRCPQARQVYSKSGMLVKEMQRNRRR